MPTVEPGSRVGVNLVDFSRLISYDNVTSSIQRDKVKQFILDLPYPFIWQNCETLREQIRQRFI